MRNQLPELGIPSADARHCTSLMRNILHGVQPQIPRSSAANTLRLHYCHSGVSRSHGEIPYEATLQ